MSVERRRSSWWFLMPILFGLIGAVIAYFVIRGDDPKLAKNCLYLGLALFGISIISSIIFNQAILLTLDDYGVNA